MLSDALHLRPAPLIRKPRRKTIHTNLHGEVRPPLVRAQRFTHTKTITRARPSDETSDIYAHQAELQQLPHGFGPAILNLPSSILPHLTHLKRPRKHHARQLGRPIKARADIRFEGDLHVSLR